MIIKGNRIACVLLAASALAGLPAGFLSAQEGEPHFRMGFGGGVAAGETADPDGEGTAPPEGAGNNLTDFEVDGELDGLVGAPYQVVLSPDGGGEAVSWTWGGSLPDGVSATPPSGGIASSLTLTGHPTAEGAGEFTFASTDAEGVTTTGSFFWDVGSLVVAAPSAASTTAGTTGSLELSMPGANGGVTWTKISGPTWISLQADPANPATGLVSYTPPVATSTATATFRGVDTIGATAEITIAFSGDFNLDPLVSMGFNYRGLLGIGLTQAELERPTSPVSVLLPAGVTGFSEIATHHYTVCGLADGTAYCWGYNRWGVLGRGFSQDASDYPTPEPVVMPPGAAFTGISVGGGTSFFACAVDTTGQGWCWGQQAGGNLGNGLTASASVSTPQPVTMPAGWRFLEIAVGGGAYACALAEDDDGERAVFCWGTSVPLPGGGLGNRSLPTRAPLPAGEVPTSTFGQCVTTVSGQAYCWGQNNSGQVGDGSLTNAVTPTPVSMPNGVGFTQITGEQTSRCALGTDMRAYCWGSNQYGHLGVGEGLARSEVPLPVAGGLTFARLAKMRHGAFHCGITAGGRLHCWGSVSPLNVAMPEGSAAQNWTPLAMLYADRVRDFSMDVASFVIQD